MEKFLDGFLGWIAENVLMGTGTAWEQITEQATITDIFVFATMLLIALVAYLRTAKIGVFFWIKRSISK